MKFTAKNYAHALFESLSDTNPKDADKILDNFVKVLAENNDLRLFEEISSEFHRLELQKKGIKEVEITSASPINKENEQMILHELNKIVKGDFEVKKKIDEKIIGGVMIQVDDKMLDATVKNQLEELKKDLMQ